jgi:polyphosphate kinase
MMGRNMVWRVEVLTTALRSFRAASLQKELVSAWVEQKEAKNGNSKKS